MKKVILALVLFSVMACKKNKEKDSDIVNSAKTLNNISSAMEDIEKQIENPEKEIPLVAYC